MSAPPERTALYRLYDIEGTLLYIGITADRDARWQRHSMFQPWWDRVAHKSVDWIPTRAEAAATEEAAIRSERPRHNGTHNYPLAPFTPGRWPTLDSSGSKQVTLAALIRSEVMSGRWTKGHKIPSCRDLALATGVSRSTAVLAIRGLQEDGTLRFRHGFGVFVA